MSTFTDPVEMFSLLMNVNPFQKTGSVENRRFSRYIQENALEETGLC